MKTLQHNNKLVVSTAIDLVDAAEGIRVSVVMKAKVLAARNENGALEYHSANRKRLLHRKTKRTT